MPKIQTSAEAFEKSKHVPESDGSLTRCIYWARNEKLVDLDPALKWELLRALGYCAHAGIPVRVAHPGNDALTKWAKRYSDTRGRVARFTSPGAGAFADDFVRTAAPKKVMLDMLQRDLTIGQSYVQAAKILVSFQGYLPGRFYIDSKFLMFPFGVIPGQE